MSITIVETACPQIKASRCPTYKTKASDCTNQNYDNRPPIACGTQVQSGGAGITITRHYASGMGVIVLSYAAQEQPDLFEILVDGVLVATTVDPVSYYGTIQFYYNGTGNITVRVTGTGTTQWSYTLACPI